MNIELHLGDLLTASCDALVNPANSQLMMSGGVAAVIKQRGGQAIEAAAAALAPCPVGQAVLTSAGSLPYKGIIHAPTMEHSAEPIPAKQVELATIAALRLADEQHYQSIAFPAMGTGVGQVAYDDAAKIMMESIQMYMVDNQLTTVHVYVKDQAAYDAFKRYE